MFQYWSYSVIIHFPQEYKRVIDQQSPHILLDVREPVELEICSLPTESLSILHLQVFSFFNDNIVILKIDIWLSYPTKLVQRVNNWNQPIRSPHCWSIMLLVLDLALQSQMILQHNSTWRSLGSLSLVIIKYLIDQATWDHTGRISALNLSVPVWPLCWASKMYRPLTSVHWLFRSHQIIRQHKFSLIIKIIERYSTENSPFLWATKHTERVNYHSG